MALKVYSREDMLPVHTRVLFLFDLLREIYHNCAINNLYNNTIL